MTSPVPPHEQIANQAPHSERIRHLRNDSDTNSPPQVWYDLFTNDEHHEYADYFLRLIRHLQNPSVVARLIEHLFTTTRSTDRDRRQYDMLTYEQCRNVIEQHLSVLPTRHLPLPSEMARAYPALNYVIMNFVEVLEIGHPPRYFRWFREPVPVGLNWLRNLYQGYLRSGNI